MPKNKKPQKHSTPSTSAGRPAPRNAVKVNGAEIVRLRNIKGWTQEQLANAYIVAAKKTGTGAFETALSNIKRWEKDGNLFRDTLGILAKVFEVSPQSLLPDSAVLNEIESEGPNTENLAPCGIAILALKNRIEKEFAKSDDYDYLIDTWSVLVGVWFSLNMIADVVASNVPDTKEKKKFAECLFSEFAQYRTDPQIVNRVLQAERNINLKQGVDSRPCGTGLLSLQEYHKWLSGYFLINAEYRIRFSLMKRLNTLLGGKEDAAADIFKAYSTEQTSAIFKLFNREDKEYSSKRWTHTINALGELIEIFNDCLNRRLSLVKPKLGDIPTNASSTSPTLVKQTLDSKRLVTEESKGSFTDGDWITAAIVGPERAEIVLKKLIRELKVMQANTRDEAISCIEEKVTSVISDLAARYKRGGQTPEERLDACIAKVVADILERELSNFSWKLEEKIDEDPLMVFRNTVKTFMETEQKKWKH